MGSCVTEGSDCLGSLFHRWHSCCCCCAHLCEIQGLPYKMMTHVMTRFVRVVVVFSGLVDLVSILFLEEKIYQVSMCVRRFICVFRSQMQDENWLLLAPTRSCSVKHMVQPSCSTVYYTIVCGENEEYSMLTALLQPEAGMLHAHSILPTPHPNFAASGGS